MKLADALSMLLRRWYIVVPGIVLAITSALIAWTVIEPEYERQGVQVILPGAGTLPENATNPYLYLGGLALPTDIVVQAVSGQDVMEVALANFPGATVEVERSGASAPIITITVTANSDVAAERLLADMLERTKSALDSMQTSEGITERDRLSIVTLTMDTESQLIQRTRLLLVAGVGIGVVALTLVTAALIEGLAARRRRRRPNDRARPSLSKAPADDSTPPDEEGPSPSESTRTRADQDSALASILRDT